MYEAKGKVIIQGRMATGINIGGIRLIEYVLPRRIFGRAEMVERKTHIHGMKVLHKITGNGMLKIIIIKIIAILLFLNLY